MIQVHVFTESFPSLDKKHQGERMTWEVEDFVCALTNL